MELGEEAGARLADAFAQAVKFALARPDFDRAEGERYLALAFDRDQGVEYGLVSRRLGQMGAFGRERAAGAAAKAFFGQRPWALASLALDWPEAVAASRDDGLDICKHGLAMAVATCRRDAAIGLAAAMGGQPMAWERLEAAFAIARGVADPQVQSSIAWVDEDGSSERGRLVGQIIAECERAAIGAAVPEGAKSVRGAKIL